MITAKRHHYLSNMPGAKQGGSTSIQLGGYAVGLEGPWGPN